LVISSAAIRSPADMIKKGEKVEGVNSFKLLYGGLDFLARAGRE
jgi:hypothetical protein